jgi:hypothetical protein
MRTSVKSAVMVCDQVINQSGKRHHTPSRLPRVHDERSDSSEGPRIVTCVQIPQLPEALDQNGTTSASIRFTSSFDKEVRWAWFVGLASALRMTAR